MHPADPNLHYAGTNSGLYRLDQSDGNWTQPPLGEIRALFRLPDQPLT